jgi:large subunit ribosomal protein L5
MQPRLKAQYKDVVLPHLQKEFDYGNVMEVPKLEKIVLNTCLKEAITNMKILESAAQEIGLITG